MIVYLQVIVADIDYSGLCPVGLTELDLKISSNHDFHLFIED